MKEGIRRGQSDQDRAYGPGIGMDQYGRTVRPAPHNYKDCADKIADHDSA
jgi:hypothetical protein